MKLEIDNNIKVKIELSLKFNLSKLNIFEIFLLLEVVFKFISHLF
ncbi:hypothetical protein U728_492 [Clostridium botulinum 202F]|nr:hypothetical protein U728_492 [Clostridium botulinum 202F]